MAFIKTVVDGRILYFSSVCSLFGRRSLLYLLLFAVVIGMLLPFNPADLNKVQVAVNSKTNPTNPLPDPPSTVGTDTSSLAWSRATCVTNTRHLVAWADGTNFVASNSSDGATWSAKMVLHSGITGNSKIALACDSSGNFYYVTTTGTYTYFRKGSLNSGTGATTWAATEKLIVDNSGSGYSRLAINVDSAGHPIVAWSDNGGGTKVALNSATDGTWVNATGFPKKLDTVQQLIEIAPQTAQKFYAVWGALNNGSIFGAAYNAGWGSTVTIASNSSTNGYPISVTSTGDIVHLAYVDTSGNQKYCVYSGTWTCQATIATIAASDPCTLTDISANSTLDCFWIGAYSSNTEINYRRRSSDGATGTWEVGNQTWFVDSQATISVNRVMISASYQDFGNTISLIYYTGAASPFNVRYNFINDLVTQPITLTVSPVGAPTGTFTVSGCGVSPTTVAGDGSSHSVTAAGSCSLTVTVPADGANTRDRFSGTSTTWTFTTCSHGTCSGQPNTYYYQLQNTYQATPKPATTTWVTGLSIIITGQYLGLSNQNICTINPTSGVTTPASCPGWADYGVVVTVSSTASGAPTNTRWIGLTTLTFTQTTGGNTNNVDFYEQFQVSFTATGITTDTGSSAIVKVAGINYTLAQLPTTAWYNNTASVTYQFWGTIVGPSSTYFWGSTSGLSQTLQTNTFTVSQTGTVTGVYSSQVILTINLNGHGTSNPTSGNTYSFGTVVTIQISSGGTNNTSNIRYLLNTISGAGSGSYTGNSYASFTVTMNAPITETITWTTQYNVTFAQSGVSTDTSTNTVLSLQGSNYQKSQLPYAAWYNSGTSISYSYQTVASTTTGKQYSCSSVSGLSQTLCANTFTASAGGTITATFVIQYQLTIVSNGHGVATPSSGTYYASGAVVTVTIASDSTSNSSSTRYLVLNETGVGSGSFSGHLSSFTVTMNAPITETFYWYTQFGITFDDSGIGGDTSSAVVITIAGVNYQQSQLPYVAWYNSSLSVPYSYSSLVVSSSTKQYMWTSTTGLQSARSTTFSVTQGGTITGSYITQYQITVAQSGLGSDTSTNVVVSINGINYQKSQLPYAAWYNATTFTYSFSGLVGGVGEQYVWFSTSGLSQTLQSNTFSLTTGGTITGTFSVAYQVTFTSSGIGSDSGSTIVVTVNSVTYVQGSLPYTAYYASGASLTYSFSSPISVSSQKQYVWLSTSGLSQTLQTNTFTVTGIGTVTGTFKIQYKAIVTSSGIGNGATGTVVTVNSVPYTQSQLPLTTGWLDANTTITYSFSSPISSPPSTVGTSTNNLLWAGGRQTCVVNTRHLVVWSDGTNAVASNSSDGATWSTKMTLHAGITSNTRITLACDSSGNFYYAASTNTAVWFRKGSLNSGTGATTWAAVEQQVIDDSGSAYARLSVNIDSAGHPIIGWGDNNKGTKVALSSTTDGTWVNATGFPKKLDSVQQDIAIAPQTAQQFYVVFGAKSNATIFGAAYSSGWGSTVTIATNQTNVGNVTFSVTSAGDIVHLTYLDTSNNQKYCVFSSSWTCQATIATAGSGNTPCTLTDIASNSTLDCFWLSGSEGAYYRQRSSDGASGSWAAGNQTWFKDTQSFTSANRVMISASYKDFGNIVSFVYLTGSASPWNVRYDFINDPPIGKQSGWSSTSGFGQSLQSSSFALNSVDTLTGSYVIQYDLKVQAIDGYSQLVLKTGDASMTVGSTTLKADSNGYMDFGYFASGSSINIVAKYRGTTVNATWASSSYVVSSSVYLWKFEYQASLTATASVMSGQATDKTSWNFTAYYVKTNSSATFNTGTVYLYYQSATYQVCTKTIVALSTVCTATQSLAGPLNPQTANVFLNVTDGWVWVRSSTTVSYGITDSQLTDTAGTSWQSGVAEIIGYGYTNTASAGTGPTYLIVTNTFIAISLRNSTAPLNTITSSDFNASANAFHPGTISYTIPLNFQGAFVLRFAIMQHLMNGTNVMIDYVDKTITTTNLQGSQGNSQQVIVIPNDVSLFVDQSTNDSIPKVVQGQTLDWVANVQVQGLIRNIVINNITINAVWVTVTDRLPIVVSGTITGFPLHLHLAPQGVAAEGWVVQVVVQGTIDSGQLWQPITIVAYVYPAKAAPVPPSFPYLEVASVSLTAASSVWAVVRTVSKRKIK